MINIRPMGSKTAATLLLLALLICTRLAQAHEYWLEPVESTWQVGDTLKADIKNGVDFAGDKFPLNPAVLSGAGLVSPSLRAGLRGRLGNLPAFQMPLQESGLHLLLLETTKRELVYDSSAKFEEFLEYHGLTDVVSENDDFSIPDIDIKEIYYRFCKALVMVSPGEAGTTESGTSPEQSADAVNPSAALEVQEQPLEIILSDNPLGAKTVRAQVRLQGEPLASRQVELFHRNASAEVTRTTQRSDYSGYVEFDIAESGDYLINAVWVVEPGQSSADLISLWASLFFHQ